MISDEDLIRGMKQCSRLGALAQVHAENGDIVAEVRMAWITVPGC